MTELKWHDYSRETTDELLALCGKVRTDSLVVAFEMALNQKEAREGAGSLSEEERIVVAVEAMEREVNNGGYGQFFLNTPEYAPMLVDALRRIGCPRSARLADKAMAILAAETMTETAIGRAAANLDEAQTEQLSQCDDQYFETSESIENQLFEFIRANRSRIRL